MSGLARLRRAIPADAAGIAERYGAATNLRVFDGDPDVLTEMDALVAYLQTLGRLTQTASKKE